MSARKKRPVNLELLSLRYPPTAVVSLGHRLSGVLLFLALAPALYLLQLSLQGEEGFSAAAALLGGRMARLMLAVLIWGAVHHLLAGVRLLFQDVHLGVEIGSARITARAVTLTGLLAFAFALVVLW